MGSQSSHHYENNDQHKKAQLHRNKSLFVLRVGCNKFIIRLHHPRVVEILFQELLLLGAE